MVLEFQCIYGQKHPVPGDVWHRFARCLVAGGDRYDRYMCSALFMTMRTPEECSQALEKIDLVKSKIAAEEQFGINDTYINFSASGAQVEIFIEEEPDAAEGCFNLEEFRKAICAWQEFLRTPESAYKIQVSIA